ncbi:MAG TPA: hypothetical protein VK002_13355 [Rubricoccaceae bacterium]|nr:hypothetical protein [Rubricoccaceae bacterium]
MDLAVANNAFQWVAGWGRLPDSPGTRANGRTHGVAVTADGRVVVFRQADPAVVVLEPDGTPSSTWGDRFAGAHGLTLVEEDGRELLWVTDEHSGEVAKLTLDGETVLALDPPDLPAYRAGRYAPTWVAVHERRHGGSGDVWVADGYGMSLVHRYDADGRYRMSLSGEEGAGRFDCPHAVWVDTRRAEPELYVADRGNRRLQVYDLDGTHKRTVGEGVLECPCTGVRYGDGLVVPELCARLTFLDADDRLVGYLGRNEAACALPGWPEVAPEQIRDGRFNSPHATAADAAGNLYVVEWIVGGRLTKLSRC